MFLDTNTLLVAIACASLFSAALLIGIYRLNPGEPAIIAWAIGNTLIGLGSVLNSMHGSLDSTLTLILPNFVLTLGNVLLVTGLMRFVGSPQRSGLLAILIAIEFCIHCYFVYAQPLLWVRLLNTSIFMTLLAIWPLVVLRRLSASDSTYSVAIPFLLLGFALECVAYVLWMIYALRAMPVEPYVNSQSPTASVALLQILCTSFILNISFVLLVMERIHRLLRHRAAVDDLTGVFNRRAFHQIADVELARADRSHVWPALLVLDLDHFKQINDCYGHHAGDEVLRRFGALIKSCTRAGDIVARMGGEEFAALLPTTDLDRASSVAERIRATLEQEAFCVDQRQFRVTTSIGLSIIRPEDTLHSAFVRADHALYEAKEQGRNRVIARTTPTSVNEAEPPSAPPRAPAAPAAEPPAIHGTAAVALAASPFPAAFPAASPTSTSSLF